ncbi:MAG: hypothetical protein ACM3SU_09495 [Acidobacteriota bacterium]
MRCRAWIPSILAMLLAATAAAQHEGHPQGHPEDGSGAQVGQVHFPVSCNEAAQEEFDRAVAMLHSFWYEEAGKAFAAVAAADSSCAMAHWGVAMSFYHPLWFPPSAAELEKGRAAASKAKEIGGKTDRENAFIAAINTFYRDADRLDHKTRALAYEKAMEAVHVSYPKDREASAFYALALISTAPPTDRTFANQKKAAAILDAIAEEAPGHPGVYHYSIHAYDTPELAPLALKAARGYAKVAPAVPHALHMPSHIFTRLGLWPESIDSNVASAKAARDFAARARMAGVWDQELHALDYLEYAYLQRGDDARALAVLDRVRQVRAVDPQNVIAAFALSAVPARYVIEGRRWEEAASLSLSPADFPWKNFGIAEAMTRWARAMGAVQQGRLDSVREEVEALGSLRNSVKGQAGYDWSIAIEILRLEAAAWLAHAGGDGAGSATTLREAADLEDSTQKHPVTPGAIVPAREQLADLLLAIGRPADALAEYEKSLASAPNRFNGLVGAARAARKAGDAGRAGGYYGRLIAISDASSRRPELDEARKFLRGGKSTSKTRTGELRSPEPTVVSPSPRGVVAARGGL